MEHKKRCEAFFFQSTCNYAIKVFARCDICMLLKVKTNTLWFLRMHCNEFDELFTTSKWNSYIFCKAYFHSRLTPCSFSTTVVILFFKPVVTLKISPNKPQIQLLKNTSKLNYIKMKRFFFSNLHNITKNEAYSCISLTHFKENRCVRSSRANSSKGSWCRKTI